MNAGMTAMKSKFVQYYVEGEDDKKVVDTLKTKLRLILPGKVSVLNVVAHEVPEMRLRVLSPGTMVVLAFDVDAGNVEILNRNIQKFKACKAVSEIVLIPQVPNLEGELVRSCNIKKIEQLLNSKSRSDFKSDVIRVSNLDAKLREHQFNIDRFWSAPATQPYQNIENQAHRIKLKSK